MASGALDLSPAAYQDEESDEDHVDVVPMFQSKGPWTSQEDSMLVSLIRQFGSSDWAHLSRLMASMGRHRVGKQCRERWFNHLSRDVRKDPWTESEDMIIARAHAQIGNKWTAISHLLVGRPANAVKNHWNATLKRKLSMSMDATGTGSGSGKRARTYKRRKEEPMTAEPTEPLEPEPEFPTKRRRSVDQDQVPRPSKRRKLNSSKPTDDDLDRDSTVSLTDGASVTSHASAESEDVQASCQEATNAASSCPQLPEAEAEPPLQGEAEPPQREAEPTQAEVEPPLGEEEPLQAEVEEEEEQEGELCPRVDPYDQTPGCEPTGDAFVPWDAWSLQFTYV